jgi:hypothetical protein
MARQRGDEVQTVKPIADRADIPFDAIKRQAAKDYGVPIDDLQVSVQEGHGIHSHGNGNDCRLFGGECYSRHNNSDWIVTVVYDGYHEAVYGVLNGAYSLWMD